MRTRKGLEVLPAKPATKSPKKAEKKSEKASIKESFVETKKRGLPEKVIKDEPTNPSTSRRGTKESTQETKSVDDPTIKKANTSRSKEELMSPTSDAISKTADVARMESPRSRRQLNAMQKVPQQVIVEKPAKMKTDGKITRQKEVDNLEQKRLIDPSQDDSKTASGSSRKRNESTTSTIESLSEERNQRKRRKPAAFDDYVDYDLTASRKPRNLLETRATSNADNKEMESPQRPLETMQSQLRRSPVKIESKPIISNNTTYPREKMNLNQPNDSIQQSRQQPQQPVRTLIRQMASNVQQIQRFSQQPPPPQQMLMARDKHHSAIIHQKSPPPPQQDGFAEDVYRQKTSIMEVDVDVAENLEISTSSPQLSPKRPAILSRKVHHIPQSPKRPGQPVQAPPPRAAPLLVAGPPRSHGPPPKSAAQVLQTQVTKQHPTLVRQRQQISHKSHPGRFSQTVDREGFFPSTSRASLGITRLQQNVVKTTGKFSEADQRLIIQIADRDIFLESLMISEGGVPRAAYGMYSENGTLIGLGNINEQGEFVQEIDEMQNVGDEVQIVDETVEIDQQETRQKTLSRVDPASFKKRISSMMPENTDDNLDDNDDDGPPELEPEVAEVEQPPPPPQEVTFHENDIAYDEQELIGEGEYIDDETMEYVDGDVAVIPGEGEVRTVEFNFLDKHNIGCGLCGEIVPEELLMSEHLPNAHPEVLGDGTNELEEIPYEAWLREKIGNEKRSMESGYRTSLPYGYGIPRATRKVSSVRVCPAEMTLQQLDDCLKKKMVEKLGRRVRVSLVDKLHARCGECGAIISLNKKFEIMHLVRHFNAWHPTSHRCAGTWQRKNPQPGLGKPLSIQDFCLADKSLDSTVDNLQCIWCGMLMTKDTLAMHFHEVHADEIEVPSCRLCIEELVINARLRELYLEDFDIILPDEKHYECPKFSIKTTSEKNLQKAINKRLTAQVGEYDDDDDDDRCSDDEDRLENKPVMNSRMQYGRRNKPKRTFVMPAYRQTAPTNSEYVEALTETQWRCKKCDFIIMAAVMSAGCISHYKKCHPELHDKLRYELCKIRLEYISDKCMEFVHASLIECLVCQIPFALHRPYNMCRAIRHLQKKHPEMMPESQQGTQIGYSLNHVSLNTEERRRGSRREEKAANIEQNEETILTDVEIQRLREVSNVYFDEVRIIPGDNGEQVFLLLNDGKVVDQQTQTAILGSREGTTEPTGYVEQFAEGEYVELHPTSSGQHKDTQDTPVIIELDEAEYFDDDEAPIPSEDGAMFRRLYEVKSYHEMQENNTLRVEPPGYLRRALELSGNDGFRILEYFVPEEVYEEELEEHDQAESHK
ncbi:unnamed protein product, partial [Mesorhabditis belari]|uniref:C2H2-type domain-containing protein n=1 Tax=Mesorhabditis belari TaxID=2138241 RepID=A0AAF3EUX8_9BILA